MNLHRAKPGELDQQLWARACLGEKDSFEALAQRHYGRVLCRARALLGSAGRAEEVTQDVFLRLYRTAKHYDGRTPFAFCLSVVLHRVCANAKRNDAREARRRLELATYTHTQKPAILRCASSSASANSV